MNQSTKDLSDMIHTHQAGVWRYLRVLGCDPSLADDLTQETFLRMMKGPAAIRDGAATAAYLRRVAKNLLIDSRRASRRAQEHSSVLRDVERAEAAWSSLASDGSGEDVLAALRLCFTELDPRSQDALRERYEKKLGRSDLAASLELSPEGAKTVLRRAKARLKTCIERRLGR